MEKFEDSAAIAPSQTGSTNDLRPDEEIQKILISVTARFTGEFVSQNLLLTHAWPPFHTGRRDCFGEQTPLARTAFMVSFRTVRSPKLPGYEIPNYEHAGVIIASVCSVLFGKRFDVHGPVEMSGSFGVPDLSQFAVPNNRLLPHNSQRPRTDYPIPLDLSEARRMRPLFLGDHPDKVASSAFLAAARFYLRALQAVEDDPEAAYLHLITTGEIIANHKPFIEAVHLDEATRDALARIEQDLRGGVAIAKQLRGQLRGIKRRFVTGITSYIEPDFFERREAEHAYDALRPDDFAKRIGAAYDLRSKSVHAGHPFGVWVKPRNDNAEIQAGRPVIEDDKELSKILYKAPLFIGLERVMRCALLGFAQELGADLSNIDANTEVGDNVSSADMAGTV